MGPLAAAKDDENKFDPISSFPGFQSWLSVGRTQPEARVQWSPWLSTSWGHWTGWEENLLLELLFAPYSPMLEVGGFPCRTKVSFLVWLRFLWWERVSEADYASVLCSPMHETGAINRDHFLYSAILDSLMSECPFLWIVIFREPWSGIQETWGGCLAQIPLLIWIFWFAKPGTRNRLSWFSRTRLILNVSSKKWV